MPAASHRWGGISGLWTKPQSDFKDLAGDGWGILIMGEQFLKPTHTVSVTSDVGYLDFGSKKFGNTTNDFSLFPVQAGLRVYPLVQKKPDSRAQIFGEGSLGFITTRSEVKTGLGSTSNYDYYFGTNAGVGVKLGAGPAKATSRICFSIWARVIDPRGANFRLRKSRNASISASLSGRCNWQNNGLASAESSSSIPLWKRRAGSIAK